MAVIKIRTAEHKLEKVRFPKLTSGCMNVDYIQVELDDSWLSLGDFDRVEYAISLNKPGAYNESGSIVLNKYDNKTVMSKIPMDVTAVPIVWEIGVFARDTVSGEFLKTSDTLLLTVEQGAPPSDAYVQDWNEIRQELIHKLNICLDCNLSEAANVAEILSAIESNPKTQTVAAWDKLFAESPLSPDIFGRTDNGTNRFWKGKIPHLNTINLTDGSNFFRGCGGVTEVSFDCTNVTKMSMTFLFPYAPNSSIQKITLKNLSNKVTNFWQCFGGQGYLTEIDADIDFSSVKSSGGTDRMFNCSSIKSVRFVPNTLSVDLDLSLCSALNKDSVFSALRACKQLETAGSAVLAFNTAVYAEDLMPEIETAVAKGFKVTFGNKTYGGTEE